MLIEFTVGNFLSFNNRETFSMNAANMVSKDEKLDIENVIRVDRDLSLLKSAAIYGANASGKSNFMTAVLFMRDFVKNSSKNTQVDEEINVREFKLSEETEERTAYFQMIFLLGKEIYRYGFEVTRQKVVREWLYFVPSSKEARLFERTADQISVSRSFKEGKKFVEITRDNALFLSVVAQWKGEISTKVLKWFDSIRIVSAIHDHGYRGFTEKKCEDSFFKEKIVNLVRKLDLGIDAINIESVDWKSIMPKVSISNEMKELVEKELLERGEKATSKIKTAHKKFNSQGEIVGSVDFDIDADESEGTKKIFALAGPLLDVLENGYVFFVDELDARLHPLLTCAIIKLFNSSQTNPNNAQLIFVTHDTNLLSGDIFRRDQIWFAEKDRQGATHIYSLADIKVRNTASFEKDYMLGRYGAIPFIGDCRRLAEV